jgi:hypothetical protein
MQAFNRAGDTMTPAIVNSFGFWRFEIALAYGLAIALRMGSNRAFFAIAIAESTMALAGAILFKPGRWEKKSKRSKRLGGVNGCLMGSRIGTSEPRSANFIWRMRTRHASGMLLGRTRWK